MGWTTYHANYFKHNGSIDRKTECDRQFAGSGYSVVKSSMVGSVYYAAVTRDESETVEAFVFLTSVEGDTFSYKDMHETCCPYEFKCPKTVLSKLTPTDDEMANKWREQCRIHNEKKKDPKLFKNIAAGTKVLWTVKGCGWSGGIRPGDQYVLMKCKKTNSNRYVWYVQGMGYIDPKFIGTDEYEFI